MVMRGSLKTLSFISCIICALPALAQNPTYKVTQTIHLPGGVRWDYLTYDAVDKRLYITRSDRVDVLDTKTMSLIGTVPDKIGVHGVALAHSLGKGYVSNGDTGTVTVFNISNLKILSVIPAADDADAIVYDQTNHRIFTANGDANSLSVIDAKIDENVGTIALGGKPEYAVLDGHGKLFVNITDKSELVAVDTVSLKLLARYDLKPSCAEPTGLAIDQDEQRLFAGCRNQVMAVVDVGSGKTLASLPIGKSNDATVYDKRRKLVFASNGDGTLSVVGKSGADHYQVLQTLKTMPGARTMALDEDENKIYLVSAEIDHVDPPTIAHPRPHPKYKDNSFVVLTISNSDYP